MRLHQLTESKQDVTEGEQRMSRAAKGHEKYGKAGMQALAKAGREGASDEQLDKIRNKYDRYDSVAEDANGEYDDEAGMATGSLKTMSRAVNGLMDTIQQGDNLPEWAQQKLSLAEDYLTTVWDYLLSQKEQGIDPKVEEGWKDIVGGAVGGGIGGALAASPAEMIPGIPWGVPALAGTALGAALGAWRAKALDKPVYQVYVNGKKASDVIGGNDAVRLIGKLASKEHDTKTTFTIMNVKSDRIVFRQVWSTNSNDTGGDPGWVGNWSGKESKEQGVEPKLENDDSFDSQFDIIESWVEQLAEQHGVDPEVIWEDFETVNDRELLDEAAAWQKKSGKNKNGGLNAKGVASYRREHPGSKLQTAVTTKPSKLKKGSKAAKRRKSFCARMGGMKGAMKKPNGEPTRKALALRKWNC